MTLPKDPKCAEEYKKRISESLEGKTATDETRKIQSELKKNPNKLPKKIHRYSPEEYQRNKEKYLERQRRYRNNPKNREEYLRKARESSKRWYLRNKQKRYAYNKKWWKKYVASLEKDAGRKKPKNCEICGEKTRICFDHCHTTGKFRGWICDRCNIVLGRVKDDVKLLDSLKKYLENSVK